MTQINQDEIGDVFSPEYWGEPLKVETQPDVRASLPVMIRQTAVNLLSGVVSTSVGIKAGYHLPDGSPLDFANPDATGMQHLPSAVLLVDHETLDTVYANLNTKTEYILQPDAIDETAHDLIRLGIEINKEETKAKLRQKRVTITDGEQVYTRRARIIGVSGLRNNTRIPLEYRTFNMKQGLTDDGMPYVRPSRFNFGRVAFDLMYPHRIGRTMQLPNGVLSRVGVEVITHGQEWQKKRKTRSLSYKTRLAYDD